MSPLFPSHRLGIPAQGVTPKSCESDVRCEFLRGKIPSRGGQGAVGPCVLRPAPFPFPSIFSGAGRQERFRHEDGCGRPQLRHHCRRPCPLMRDVSVLWKRGEALLSSGVSRMLSLHFTACRQVTVIHLCETKKKKKKSHVVATAAASPK